MTKHTIVAAADASEVKLPANVEQTIAEAEAGDPRAWARLYGIAAVIVRAGLGVPEPLRTVVADRLEALQHGLWAQPLGDVRQVALAAMLPVRRGRLVGAKAKPALRIAAEAAVDMLDIDKAYGRRKAIVAILSKKTGLATESIDDEIDVVRKARRQK